MPRGSSSYSIHQLNYIHSVKINMLIKLLFQWLYCLKPKMSVVHTPTHRACFISSLTASWKAHCLQGGWVWHGASELPTDSRDAAPARAHSDNQEWPWSCFSHRMNLLVTWEKGLLKCTQASLKYSYLSAKSETVHIHRFPAACHQASSRTGRSSREHLPLLLFTATDTSESLFPPICGAILNIGNEINKLFRLYFPMPWKAVVLSISKELS